MHGDQHALRRGVHDRVHDLEVAVQQRSPVVAALVQAPPHLRIAELGEGRLVELHIAAAGGGQGRQLAAVGLDHVGPEGVEARIGGAVDGAPAATEVDVTGAGQGDLGQGAGVGLQEVEVGGVARAAAPADGPHDLGPRGGRRRAIAAAETPGPCLADLDAVQRGFQEGVGVHAPAHLAIGDDGKAQLFLEPDRVDHRPVLFGAQIGGHDPASRKPPARLTQRRRSQEAADGLGPRRRPLQLHAHPCSALVEPSFRMGGRPCLRRLSAPPQAPIARAIVTPAGSCPARGAGTSRRCRRTRRGRSGPPRSPAAGRWSGPSRR